MTLLAWQAPVAGGVSRRVPERVPSKPVQTYAVGQLSLTLGVAVIALAAWLQIMRTHGIRGQ